MIKKIHCLKYQKANPKKRDIALLWHKVPHWTEIPFHFHNWIGWIALCLAFCKMHFGSNLDFYGVVLSVLLSALRRMGKAEYADRIDRMLEQQFMPCADTFTTRKALKMLADKFICHYDNFDGANNEGWGFGVVIEKRLMNPYDNPNLVII